MFQFPEACFRLSCMKREKERDREREREKEKKKERKRERTWEREHESEREIMTGFLWVNVLKHRV